MAVIVGTLLALVIVALALVVALAIQMSYFACVVERLPFITAFARGLSRVFNKVGLRRAFLVGLAYVAIFLGVYFVTVAGQAVLYGLVRSNVAGSAYSTLVEVATAAFSTAFIAIFYFDLRVREEGLDLQVAAAGNAPASTT